ncbi:O-antigen ligase [Novosphingobium fluoreni]|uniref:O-antigen ligase n=1 Tax=Novosphingobium fluoreni TaxID=1391222 RepID=A0A7W6C5R3_9SPHN|nr:O-antigen ligase family protein [Novosphingobium fluoreni]MBB3938907.1 O-antigen ligase [Novosphingobium fluoreni]
MKLQVADPKDSTAVTVLASFSFVLLLVLVLATPFMDMSGALSPGQKVFRIYVYGVVGLLQAALIVARGWERSLRAFRTPMLPLLLWCALSLAWTQHVELTGKRLILLSLVYLGIFSGVCDLGTRRSSKILRIAVVGALILNFAVVLWAPALGTQMFEGQSLWRGFMAHKNIAGVLCAVTIILFAFDSRKVPAVGRYAVILGALIFFFQAWSKTAWLALPTALAAGGAILLFSKRYLPPSGPSSRSQVMGTRIVYGLLLLGLALLTVQRDFFLSLTNNTMALTGRGAIWRPMIQFYLDHPLLGSGYGAYWDASANLLDPEAPGAGMWKNIDQGHNGYLDLLVQLGLPGLALALYAALVWPMAQIGSMIGRQPQRAALILALLVFFLLENFSESSLFADDALGNAFLLIALAQLHRYGLRYEQNGRTKTSGTKEGDEFQNLAEMRMGRQKRRQAAAESLSEES